jgi:hypothetical protein
MFPSMEAPQTQITLTFDSAGSLVRYSDRRGAVRFRASPNATASERDGAFTAIRSTTISFDYPINQAMAMNSGGGTPTEAVMGSIRSMESIEKLGPPTERIRRARRLCGV